MLDALPAPVDIAAGIAPEQKAAQAEVDAAAAQAAAERAKRVAAEAADRLRRTGRGPRRRSRRRWTAAGYAGAARYEIDERGLVVHIVADAVLFDAEQAVLRPEGKAILDAVAPTLTGLPNVLRVEGHANHLPVTPGGPWPSNWELSAYRATTVLRYLAGDGVPEPRMSAAGYGSTQPLVPDHRPDGHHRQPPRRHRRPVHRLRRGQRPAAGHRRRTPRSHAMSTKEKAAETDEAEAKGGKKKLILILARGAPRRGRGGVLLPVLGGERGGRGAGVQRHLPRPRPGRGEPRRVAAT